MRNIIVAFSKRENVVSIRNILVKSGFCDPAVCVTGSKVLQYAEMWNSGIVICGYRLQDMQYMQLKALLPEGFEMLLIAPAEKWTDELPEGVIGLPCPLKVYDLINTVEMMENAQQRKRRKQRDNIRKRDNAERQVIDRAKALLMERNNMSEEEAHRYLQKTSMESGTNMTETAEMILTVMEK